jgi:hypothetical protein
MQLHDACAPQLGMGLVEIFDFGGSQSAPLTPPSGGHFNAHPSVVKQLIGRWVTFFPSAEWQSLRMYSHRCADGLHWYAKTRRESEQ